MDVWLRDGDWRMPIRAGGILEIFDGLRLCVELDALLLLDLLAAHTRIAQIADAMTTPAAPPLPERKPLAPPLPSSVTPAQRAARRAQRKGRRRA
jgi:hypothetical protein